MANDEWPLDLKETAKAAGGLLFMLAVGLCFAALWWRDWRLLSEAPHWPQTNGVVVESRIESVSPMNLRWAQITYDYTAPEFERLGQSSRLRPYQDGVSSSVWPFADAEEIVALHPIGSSVTVHYDPEDPGRSVLAAWLLWNHAGSWLWLVMAVFVLGVATHFIIAPFVLYVIRSVR